MLKTGMVLLLALAAITICHCVEEKQFGFRIGDNEQVFVSCTAIDKPVGQLESSQLAALIADSRRIVGEYLEAILSPKFTWTKIAMNKANRFFISSMERLAYDVRKTATYLDSPQLQQKISNITKFFMNASFRAKKAIDHKEMKKLDARARLSHDEIMHIGILLEETFNKVGSDCQLNIEKIKINDISLPEMTKIYFDLMRRDGLDEAIEAIGVGLSMTFFAKN